MEVYSQELATGTGRAWLYIEPDGDVLPAKGSDQILGNILKDSWDRIWKAANQTLAD
jgi:MoaA/NifB/PqqE/SkfB family radical SAM enzyme